MQEKPQHKHLLVRAEVRRPFCESDMKLATSWLTELIHNIGMKIIGGPYVAYATSPGNTGLTACALIETSHVSLHVWHEDNPPLVQLDVYTCSDLNPKDVFRHMEIFAPTKIEYKFLDREHGLEIIEETDVFS